MVRQNFNFQPSAALSALGALGLASPLIEPQGRLTLSTGVPVMASTVSASATVLYTPYVGNLIPIQLVSGGAWGLYAFAELTNTLSDATKNPAAVVDNANYDLFVWNDAGTLRLSRGPLWQVTGTVTTPVASPGVVNWAGHGLQIGDPVSFSGGVLPTGIVAGTTYYVIAAGFTANAFEIASTPGGGAINFTGTSSGTQTAVGGSEVTRGTGAGTTQLSRVAGVLVNTVAITNGPGAGLGTYVGSIRTNASGTVDFILGGSSAGGTAAVLGVWNQFNRRLTHTNTIDTTTGYSYTTATARAADASNGNRVSFILGQQEDQVQVEYGMKVQLAAAVNAVARLFLGFDSTTANTADSEGAYILNNVAAALAGSIKANYRAVPAIGWHYIQGMEMGDGTNATVWNQGGGFEGLRAAVWC